jgi:hypothetical protein
LALQRRNADLERRSRGKGRIFFGCLNGWPRINPDSPERPGSLGRGETDLLATPPRETNS